MTGGCVTISRCASLNSFKKNCVLIKKICLKFIQNITVRKVRYYLKDNFIAELSDRERERERERERLPIKFEKYLLRVYTLLIRSI